MTMVIFSVFLLKLNLLPTFYLLFSQLVGSTRPEEIMCIDLDLLFTWGALAKEYKKNDVIINEGETALFYFQVMDGCVRMFNSNDDGKEFTQGYFCNGQSFGEPPLFIDEKYPATATAFQDCTIVKLSKDKFLKILDEYPSIQKKFLVLMAQRIHSKAKTSKDIINQKPEFRILAFLNSNKKSNDGAKELVPFTRQEIANFTGLRVETVIRVFSRMKAENKIDIINHKIYF
ncbi:MAG: Crp/Fnr family transcriptional regulator [Flavobacteriaceae bacterium]